MFTSLYTMNIYENLINRNSSIAVIGLGYVGMPLAIEFGKKVKVIGYDISTDKINLYRSGIDPTSEVGNNIIKQSKVHFTNDEKVLEDCNFCIIAVPTPINLDKTPDLEPVIKASKIIGKRLQKNSIVVYESTVYPGVTEDICIPILEKESGLRCGDDFKVGYSPERINPGDKQHKLSNIVKIVSGIDHEATNEIAKVYNLIVDVGVYKVSSIKVAEAAKVVENSQRDINIAFMNELAMVFKKMDIDSNEVIEAMNTKWNALGFRPGLVGGHCIGVDPYYFIYKAENLGYHSQIISSGRKVNDSMGKFVADEIVKKLALSGIIVKNASVAILGITFKENCPDVRNSKVFDIIMRLNEFGIYPAVSDYLADDNEVLNKYGIKLIEDEKLKNIDCLVFAVSHQKYYSLQVHNLLKLFNNNGPKLLFDIKGIFDTEVCKKADIDLWRL